MAISLRAVGSWATNTSTTQTVTLPTHAAGDMLIVRAIRKPYTSPTGLVCNTTGWAAAFTGYANGSTANGVGVGSMAVCVFYKEAASASETNPVVTWGTTAAPGACVALSYQKASNETWGTPTGAAGLDSTAATTINDTLGTHIGVEAGDMVDVMGGWCDDSGTPSAVSISQPGVTYTVTADIPATALDTSTSNDMAADGAYALATAGPSSGAATITASFGSSEEHICCMTRLRIATVSPDAVTATATATANDATAPPSVNAAAVTATATAAAETSGGGTPAYVQALGSYNSTSSLTAHPISCSKTVTVGNTIVLAVGHYSSTAPTSVTDNLGNTYTHISTQVSSITVRARIYSAPVTTGGTLTAITANFSPAQSYVSLAASEFSGLAGSPTDGGGAGSSSSGTTATWSGSDTIAANGAIVGSATVNASRSPAPGSASGSPSTTIYHGAEMESVDPSLSLAYAIAGGSQVTAFTGTSTWTSIAGWAGTSALYTASGGAATAATVNVGPSAVTATADGAVQAPVFPVNAPAEAATATGTAQQALANVGPNAATATATATGQTAGPSVKPTGTTATATGAGQTALANVMPNAVTATSTGAAQTAGAGVKPNATQATATGTAQQPTTTCLTNAQATTATATGAGQTAGASVKPNAAATTATATAQTALASVGPTAATATATGSAQTAALAFAPAVTATATATAQAAGDSVAVNADPQGCEATAVAQDAAATTGGVSTEANAVTATATGTANQPTTTCASNAPADTATASGTGLGATTGVKPTGTAATPTASAQQASVTAYGVTAAAAVTATTTGSAQQAAAKVAVNAECATATAAAANAAAALAVVIAQAAATAAGRDATVTAVDGGAYTEALAVTATAAATGQGATGLASPSAFAWADAATAIGSGRDAAIPTISGVTREEDGTVIPLCTVDAFVAATNTFYATTTSDAVGRYAFVVVPGTAYFLVAYDLVGDVYGVTARDLTA